MEAYFDNSATTKVLDCVKDAVVDAMCVNYGNAAAKHRKGVEAENLIREAKKAIADTLKVHHKDQRRGGVLRPGSPGPRRVHPAGDLPVPGGDGL